MDFDYLTLCPVCRDVEIPMGASKCRSCREQEQIDRFDYCPVMCPYCRSLMVFNPDWQKPTEFKCDGCGRNFSDAAAER